MLAKKSRETWSACYLLLTENNPIMLFMKTYFYFCFVFYQLLSFRSIMSIKEKTATLEHLMETVSEKLGLREQLEIIKIINPNARLLPTDTEFFIGKQTYIYVLL